MPFSLESSSRSHKSIVENIRWSICTRVNKNKVFVSNVTLFFSAHAKRIPGCRKLLSISVVHSLRQHNGFGYVDNAGFSSQDKGVTTAVLQRRTICDCGGSQLQGASVGRTALALILTHFVLVHAHWTRLAWVLNDVIVLPNRTSNWKNTFYQWPVEFYLISVLFFSHWSLFRKNEIIMSSWFLAVFTEFKMKSQATHCKLQHLCPLFHPGFLPAFLHWDKQNLKTPENKAFQQPLLCVVCLWSKDRTNSSEMRVR